VEFWLEYGYWGLFIVSFLAATILPFSSESILVAMIFGDFDPVLLVAYASVGNWLGGLTSYGIGRLGKWEWVERFLKIKHKTVEKWQQKSEKYGAVFGLLTWLPIIGDPIAVALGFARTHFLMTSVYMLIGKTARYALVSYLLLHGFLL
jgi:membrane protein YqaA with SNARE-associated domain